MTVLVAYAEPHAQWEIPLSLASGSLVADALAAVAAVPAFAVLPLDTMPVGIWGREVSRDAVLSPGDRLELYRPLERDPLEARRQRAHSRR
ncbi:MAG: RnfH family protein [Pseudomonadota bacterium]